MKTPAYFVLGHLLLMTSLLKGQDIPVIAGFSPAGGPAGTTVTITGENFSTTPDDNHVFFGPVRAQVHVATATVLEVTVPEGATFHPIRVTAHGLTATATSPFMLTFPFGGSIGASFTNRTDFWGGYQVKWQTVSDIDGDGKTDVVVVDEAGHVVSIMRNVSTAGNIGWNSFEPKVDFPTGIGPYAVAAEDLDGDGRPEVVVTNGPSSSISVFRNASTPGTISFASPVELRSVPGPVFVSIRDLDMDGKQDVAVACSNDFGEGFVSIFRNTSSPGEISTSAFASRTDLPAGNGGVWFVGLDDIDRDGRPDMVVSSGGDGHVSVFRNVSTPGSISSHSFAPKVDFATGAYPAIVSIADFDGDSKPDLAVGNAAGNSISLFRNTSTPGTIDASSLESSADLNSEGGPWNPTSGDLDGDGKLELIVRNVSNGTLAIFKNRSSAGTLSADSFSPPYVASTGGNSLGISIADMDGDGESDLVISNEVTNLISVFRNEDTFAASGPTNLVFTDITNTTVSASFSPSPDSPDGYIAIRRIGSFPSPPVDGVTYTVGQQIGEDEVAYIGSATSFDDSALLPGVEYFYNCYAYYGDGESIQYITSSWASNIVFTIGLDLGPIVTVSPATFSMDDEITIIFDATKSYPLNALVDASYIYMYSGIISESAESGNWNLNHVNYSLLNSLGDNKWSITFIPRYFYNYVPFDLTVHKIAIVFFDDQSHRGVSFDGRDIYLPVSPSILTPPTASPATFVSSSGFEAEWNAVYDIPEYYLDVSTTESFDSFVGGYEGKVIHGWGTIRTTVANLLPSQNYYYRVRAAGIPGTSSPISVTTTALPEVGSPNVWVKQHGGPGTDEIQAMTSDDKGNVYAAGHFTGSVTFGTITLHSQGEFDIFFVRYDPDGNVVWARSIGGPALDNEVSLTTDSKGLYMTAQFAGDIDVDPGPGTTLFTNDGAFYINDGFFARYSLSDGSLLWSRQLVDAFCWSSSSIGIDHTGIYLAGHYYGTGDLEKGSGRGVLSSRGDDDIFIAKYSPRGDLIWGRSMGGYYRDTAWGLLVDDTGLYIHGEYGWGCDFDPSESDYMLTDYGGFFGRYELGTGNLMYVKSAGNGRILSVDKHGHDLYICGEFFGIIDADPDDGTKLIGRQELSGGIIGKYNLLDGRYVWAQNIPVTGFIGPRRIIADRAGTYVSGFFAGSADFQPGPGEANRTAGGIDAFVARYTAAGNLNWAKAIGSPGFAVSIAATKTDDGFYLGGLFADTTNFDPYQGAATLTSTGREDIFIARYAPANKEKKVYAKDIVMHNTSAEESRSVTLFPNPAESHLSVTLRGFDVHEPIEVKILDAFGKPVMLRAMSAEDSSFDIGHLQRGYYFFQARQHHVMESQRFIKK